VWVGDGLSPSELESPYRNLVRKAAAKQSEDWRLAGPRTSRGYFPEELGGSAQLTTKRRGPAKPVRDKPSPAGGQNWGAVAGSLAELMPSHIELSTVRLLLASRVTVQTVS
jgi:hypothetical protein